MGTETSPWGAPAARANLLYEQNKMCVLCEAVTFCTAVRAEHQSMKSKERSRCSSMLPHPLVGWRGPLYVTRQKTWHEALPSPFFHCFVYISSPTWSFVLFPFLTSDTHWRLHVGLSCLHLCLCLSYFTSPFLIATLTS